MKVLIVNGSPRKKSNTALALKEMIKVFEKNGIETELISLGVADIRGCIACNSCMSSGRCVFDDIVNKAAESFREADGLLVGTPVYYASANSTLISFLTRLFYSTNFDKTMKVGAGIAVARRGGLSSTFDELNKFFTISGMPVASSCYWNSVHGCFPGEVEKDEEGMQTMRVLAENMSFLMKSIALGKEAYGLPQKEHSIATNFIRD